MKTYQSIQFTTVSNDQKEWLIAALMDLGFDGIEEKEGQEGQVLAYMDTVKYSEENIENELNNLFNQLQLTYSKSIIKEENWNKLWESNFDPVRINDFVGIRAGFHPSFEPKVQIEIEITPKMSFGTGHHATTHLVIAMMEKLPIQGASVYDFGTGTGVLAIIAEKLGARTVLAVDNDDWCIENANENIVTNQCAHIKVQKVDTAEQEATFDIVLANVNRHIIEANMAFLTKAAKDHAILVLSGLLIEDQADMSKLASQFGWETIEVTNLRGWISMLLKK